MSLIAAALLRHWCVASSLWRQLANWKKKCEIWISFLYNMRGTLTKKKKIPKTTTERTYPFFFVLGVDPVLVELDNVRVIELRQGVKDHFDLFIVGLEIAALAERHLSKERSATFRRFTARAKPARVKTLSLQCRMTSRFDRAFRGAMCSCPWFSGFSKDRSLISGDQFASHTHTRACMCVSTQKRTNEISSQQGLLFWICLIIFQNDPILLGRDL